MLFSPNENLNPTAVYKPADSLLLFYSDNPILPVNDPIFSLQNNEQQWKQLQQDSDSLSLQNGQLHHNLSCVRLAAMLRGRDCATLSLDIQQGANRPPDKLNQSDQLAVQPHPSPSHSDNLNQELLTLLLNPEFYSTQPAETPASISNSLFSPEINTPLRFNDIIFDETVAANWPWPDLTPETNVISSFDSSDILNSFDSNFLSPTITANLFDVQASPSLSLAASLFNSDVFDSPLQQNNPYPTPDSYRPDTFHSSIHPSLLQSTLPSPKATPAVSSVSLGTSSTTDFCSTPLCFPSTDVNSFDLFPPLDDISVSFEANQPITENQSQIDPSLLSTLSDILQQHQQALSSANLTPDHVIALVQALTSLDIPTEQSAISSDTVVEVEDASNQAEPVSESSLAGPIRRTPAAIRKRRVTKMYACDHPGCDKAFSRHFNLKAHMKTHDPNRERPFTCELCLKTFIRAHDLMRHQPVHTKIKEYECDFCQKRFTRKDAKDRHMLLKKCK